MGGRWVRQNLAQVAVVFVHGVLSSGDVAWTADNGVSWPELLAKTRQGRRTNIFVFSYKTDYFSGAYRLSDVVDSLKEELKLAGILDFKTIIFVAHSMGGLVVRKLIVERSNHFREKNTDIGMFLLASPSLGSRYARSEERRV